MTVAIIILAIILVVWLPIWITVWVKGTKKGSTLMIIFGGLFSIGFIGLIIAIVQVVNKGSEVKTSIEKERLAIEKERLELEKQKNNK